MREICPVIFSADSTIILFEPKNFTIPSFLNISGPSAGPIRLTGFGQDSYLSILPAADRFNERLGADGRVTISKLVNSNYREINLSFQYFSEADDLLTYCLDNDKQFKLTIEIQADVGGANQSKLFIFECCLVKNDNGITVGTELEDKQFSISGILTPLSQYRRVIGLAAPEALAAIQNNG